MTRATDIAWAAGIFEGEGCIYLTKAPNPQPQLTVSMNDEDVVERFRRVAGVGVVRTWHPPNPRHATQYRWRCTSWEDALRVIQMLRPYLGARRLQQVAEFERALHAPRVRRVRRGTSLERARRTHAAESA